MFVSELCCCGVGLVPPAPAAGAGTAGEAVGARPSGQLAGRDVTSRGETLWRWEHLCLSCLSCLSCSSSARVRYNTTATRARSVRRVSETSSSDCSDEYGETSPGATEENGPEIRKRVLKQHTICCIKISSTATANPR